MKEQENTQSDPKMQKDPRKYKKKIWYGTGCLAEQKAWRELELGEWEREKREAKELEPKKREVERPQLESYYITLETPVAGRRFWVLEIAGRIVAANFYRPESAEEVQAGLQSALLSDSFTVRTPIEKETPMLQEAKRQLTEYFAGERREFCLPVVLQGTAFQLEDWQALCTIPYGETRSYGQLAAQIGRPKASRAVGMANHNNPISVIVPCHRVIGAGGKLVGYGGGLDVKEALLKLEQGL